MATKKPSTKTSHPAAPANVPGTANGTVEPAMPAAVMPTVPAGSEKTTDSAGEDEVSRQLDGLAQNIRKSYTSLTGLLQKSSVVARRLGADLNEARVLVKEGKDSWWQWLKDKCGISPSQARQVQKYIRLASNWDTLVSRGHDPSKHSIDENLAQLAAPKASAPALPEGAFRISCEGELKEKRVLAQDLALSGKLDFSADKDDGKFLKAVTDYLVRRIRQQVSEIQGRAQGFKGEDPAVIALAVVNKIQECLPVAVLEMAEVESPAPPSTVIPNPNTLVHSNGVAALAAAG